MVELSQSASRLHSMPTYPARNKDIEKTSLELLIQLESELRSYCFLTISGKCFEDKLQEIQEKENEQSTSKS